MTRGYGHEIPQCGCKRGQLDCNVWICTCNATTTGTRPKTRKRPIITKPISFRCDPDSHRANANINPKSLLIHIADSSCPDILCLAAVSLFAVSSHPQDHAIASGATSPSSASSAQPRRSTSPSTSPSCCCCRGSCGRSCWTGRRSCAC